MYVYTFAKYGHITVTFFGIIIIAVSIADAINDNKIEKYETQGKELLMKVSPKNEEQFVLEGIDSHLKLVLKDQVLKEMENERLVWSVSDRGFF
jgi:hypothetical protein